MDPVSSPPLAHVAIGLLPVLVFLGALRLLDSFKLVRLRPLGAALLAGAVAATFCYFGQTALLAWLDLDWRAFSRTLAPLIEEAAKAAYVVYLIRGRKVGFQLDAAILGFAVGTGFVLAENVYYLNAYPEGGWLLWLMRGFGTAIMHGTTTCLFALVSKHFFDRSGGILAFVPGFVLAFTLHALYNLFLLPPLLTFGVLFIVFPLLILIVFQQSERAMRHWLGFGFDVDQILLERLTVGTLVDDRVGQYLLALKTHFPAPVVADMLCLLRLHAELSIKAKGLMMMREAGFRADPGPEVESTLDEIRYLERAIGPTGMRALAPFLHAGRRDQWQQHLLQTS